MQDEHHYAKLQSVMSDYSDWVRSSAQAVLNYLNVSGKTVVDFGCGRGDWLKAARDQGAREVLGLDSYALDFEAQHLDFPIRHVDLTQPVRLEQRFDLALCMEVGEHLEARYAETLVASLVKAAPVVVFSAAVPGQGGVRHVNEQPPAYWHGLFSQHRYACYDFRQEIWNDLNIEPWYRMGVLVYAAEGTEVPSLKKFYTEAPLHLVHPDIFEAYAPIGKDLILHYDRQRKKWYPEFL